MFLAGVEGVQLRVEVGCLKEVGQIVEALFDCFLLGHKRIMVYPYQFE